MYMGLNPKRPLHFNAKYIHLPFDKISVSCIKKEDFGY